MITIALDAMGGDHAPDEIVRGAVLASLETRSVSIVLVGDRPRIESVLGETRHDRDRLSIHHAPTFVTMDDKPQEALDAKPDCSIVAAARLVALGAAGALVSAGNTGAGVLAAARTWKRLPGVRRAALAAVYPTEQRRGEKQDPFSLLLDVGATLDADAEDLVGFALMGAAYASRISNNERPKVALLSNGTEAGKGPAAVIEAHRLLTQHTDINFVGNVEGTDIPRGTADVVVCSGYVGNVVLKMLEGVGETVMSLARYAYKRRLVWRLGLAMLSGGIQQLKAITDWEQYGGAPFLGFDKLYIKAHGRSKARAIANAIKVAAKAAARGVTDEIARGLEQFRRNRAREQVGGGG
jgi:glycerol-3-phosphate acyltransferase PlsX